MRVIFCAFAVLAASIALSAPAAAMNPCVTDPDSANCSPNWGQTGSKSRSGNQQNNTTGGLCQTQGTTTGNASLSTLQSEVATLRSEVAQLQTQVQALQGQRGSLQQVAPQSSSSPPTLPATMRWGSANPPPHNSVSFSGDTMENGRFREASISAKSSRDLGLAPDPRRRACASPVRLALELP